MKYAIQTLEIEIGRVRLALRKAHEINISYEDTQEGKSPDFQGMNRHIAELEHAVEILKEWQAKKDVEQAEAEARTLQAIRERQGQ